MLTEKVIRIFDEVKELRIQNNLDREIVVTLSLRRVASGYVHLPPGRYKVCLCGSEFIERRKCAPLHMLLHLNSETEDFAWQALGHQSQLHVMVFSTTDLSSLLNSFQAQSLKISLLRDDHRLHTLRHCEC